MTQPDSHEAAEHIKPAAYFVSALDDAERLMKYAAETGVDIDETARAAVLSARSAMTTGWTEAASAGLLRALTQLAARLKPVTAESLRAYHHETRVTVRTYLRVAIVLACIIVPASIATFVTSAVSTALRDDISKANALAVKLRAELGPPSASGAPAEIPKGIGEADVISDLQDYASLVRVINARARKLNHFVVPRQRLPFEDLMTDEERKQKFELRHGIVAAAGIRLSHRLCSGCILYLPGRSHESLRQGPRTPAAQQALTAPPVIGILRALLQGAGSEHHWIGSSDFQAYWTN